MPGHAKKVVCNLTNPSKTKLSVTWLLRWNLMDYTQVCSRTRVSSCGTTTAKYLATSGWETNWDQKYSLLMRWRIKTWVEILIAQAIFCLISLRSHRSHYCKFLERTYFYCVGGDCRWRQARRVSWRCRWLYWCRILGCLNLKLKYLFFK